MKRDCNFPSLLLISIASVLGVGLFRWSFGRLFRSTCRSCRSLLCSLSSRKCHQLVHSRQFTITTGFIIGLIVIIILPNQRFHLMFGIFLWFLTFRLLLFLSLILLLLRFFGFGLISILSVLRCFFLFFGLLLQRRRVIGRSRNPWRQPVHRGTSAIFNSVWYFGIIGTHVQWGEKPTELLEIATGGAAAAAGAGLLLDEGCRLRLASSRSSDAKSNA